MLNAKGTVHYVGMCTMQNQVIHVDGSLHGFNFKILSDQLMYI